MKITAIEAYLLSYRLPEPVKLTYFGGERTILKRDAMLIRVTTDTGLVGYAPGQASIQSKQTVDQLIAPFLAGRTLADPDALRILFQQGPGADAEVSKVYSAVEIALYDLAGKAHNVAVSELIGGRVRDRIRLYGSSGMYQSPEGYAAEAVLSKSLGFTAYKMRPGNGPEADLEAVKQMRRATGPDFEIMVDAHTWWRMGNKSYSHETVEQLAKAMAEYRILWLEEPMPPDDHDAYVALNEKDLVPLATRRA